MPSAPSATVPIRFGRSRVDARDSGGRCRYDSHDLPHSPDPGFPTPMRPDHMRYALELEMLEQDGVASEEEAIDPVRSACAVAQNAGRFDAVTQADIELGDIEA